MKHYLIILVVLISSLSSLKAGSDDPYDVRIKVDGISNDMAILAYYYSDTKYIQDTVYFDENGVGVIDDTTEIPTGVYLLAFPKLKLSYFELILGPEKSFAMATDTSDLVKHMKIDRSTENKVFYENLQYMVSVGQITTKLREEIKNFEEETPEYKNIRSELVKIDEGVKAFRRDIIKKNPKTFYAKLLLMMTDIEVPENPNPKDSAFAYNYYQDHYFDNIDLTDERLIRTPILLNKIKRFLEYYTIPVPDSINVAADKILAMAKPNYNMFQFCLGGIFNKYAKSKIMAHESVYIHLAKKYYMNPEIVDWVDDEQRAKIVDVVNRKKWTPLGGIAPEIVIADIEGKTRKLYEEAEANDYTILIFWNSGCGHCKTEMPILKDLYENELKPLANIDIFAISTELEYDDWTKFLHENDLVQDGWIHCIDMFGSNPFRVKYDVVSTPIVFILDKEKTILAKRINLEDIKDLIKFDMEKH